MRRISLLAVATLSSLAISTVASSASADAALGALPRGCFISTVPEGTTLPSNAPAVFLNDTSQGATATISAELVSGDTRVPLVGPVKDPNGIAILELAGPSEGNHTIAGKVACSDGRDTSFETHIVLTAPVAFPKSVGTLERSASPRPGMDRFVLRPSAELRAFAPISVLGLNVGGGIQSGLRSPFQPDNDRVELDAHTGVACIENGALIREKRTVKVSVTAAVAGVAELPAPATLDVEVDCGAIKWTSANTDANPKPTLPTSGDDDGLSGGSASDGGCSAAPAGLGASNPAALVAGALALLAGLRRRRRRT